MVSLQFTTALMGIGLAALILYLIRRDHLYVMHGLFWVVVAGAAAVLGASPGLIDWLALLLGVSYPHAAAAAGVHGIADQGPAQRHDQYPH